MDHNIDLLKGVQHTPTHKLDLLPIVTRLSRITNQSATLTDNIYVSEQLHRNFKSVILLDDMSDHMPLLAMLKQTQLLNKEPFMFKSCCLNDSKLKTANHKLMQKDWIGLLTGMTSNTKFNQFCDTVNQVLDEVAPVKTIRISAKRRYVEPWMTRGLEDSSKVKLKLYKKSIQKGSTKEDQNNYIQHRNVYNELKRKVKHDYYQPKCKAFKDNSKKLWALINNTITKIKHEGTIIPHITVGGIKQSRLKTTTNSFDEFYSTMGSTLAEKIVPGTMSIDEYLNNIPVQRDSIVIKQTTHLRLIQ